MEKKMEKKSTLAENCKEFRADEEKLREVKESGVTRIEEKKW